MTKELTYAEAITELESIVSQIERDDIPVDELLEKVKRSSDLIAFCKEKLTKTENEVHTVLQDLHEPEEDSVEEDAQSPAGMEEAAEDSAGEEDMFSDNQDSDGEDDDEKRSAE